MSSLIFSGEIFSEPHECLYASGTRETLRLEGREECSVVAGLGGLVCSTKYDSKTTRVLSARFDVKLIFINYSL